MTKRTSPIGAAIGLAAMLIAAPLAAVDDEDFGFETTEDLQQVCTVAPDAAEAAAAGLACRAFIEATVQYHDAVSERRGLKRLICYPPTATIADGRQAFATWAEANSGDEVLMSEQPVVGLVRALADAYPCP